MELVTASDLTNSTIKTFEVFSPGGTRLLRTGLRQFDAAFGGLFPRTGNILAADQSVGKSSAALTAIRSSDVKSVLISLEDSAPMIGARILAAESGVNSLKIIRKDMTPSQAKRVKAAQAKLELAEHNYLVCDAVGAGMPDIISIVEKATAWGAKIVWLDYIQKLDTGDGDRRTGIASRYRQVQSACAAGGAALVALSQVTGVEPGAMPSPASIRETRDLANEARVIIGACVPDEAQPIVKFQVLKCSHGVGDPGDKVFRMWRGPCGTLQQKRPG